MRGGGKGLTGGKPSPAGKALIFPPPGKGLHTDRLFTGAPFIIACIYDFILHPFNVWAQSWARDTVRCTYSHGVNCLIPVSSVVW